MSDGVIRQCNDQTWVRLKTYQWKPSRDKDFTQDGMQDGMPANKNCRKFWKFVKKLKKCDHYELVPISAGVASWSQTILNCETKVVY